MFSKSEEKQRTMEKLRFLQTILMYDKYAITVYFFALSSRRSENVHCNSIIYAYSCHRWICPDTDNGSRYPGQNRLHRCRHFCKAVDHMKVMVLKSDKLKNATSKKLYMICKWRLEELTFNPCTAELFVSTFNSFEAGIALAIPASNEWKDRHLPNWIILSAEHLPQDIGTFSVVFY